MLKKLTFALLGLALVSVATQAQHLPLLKSFKVSPIDEKVLVKWTIGAGFSCSDLVVEHSTDSVNFESVYHYPGICGGTSQDETYIFLHNTPKKNAANYYRLLMAGFGSSEPVVIRVAYYGSQGFITEYIQDRPAARITFENSERITYSLQVFDLNGHEVIAVKDLSSNEVLIEAENLNPGMYFFTLTGTHTTYKGKLMF